ncbi:MAG: hypothetical protein M1826_002790 [Phylliscum demangeonii]|nr:MAG: hypothetical protein M1826_002790 [Phylliscum demangeonii]
MMQTRSSSAALCRGAPPHPPSHDDIDGPAFKRRRLEPRRLPTPDLSFEQRKSQANDGRYQTSKAPHKPTRSRLAKEKPPVRKAPLTKANLQRTREARQAQLPEALSEIIERPPTPPSEYLAEMAKIPKRSKSLRSKKSKGTLKTTTEGGLTANPFGYAEEMAENYGVLQYNYRPPPGPTILLQPTSLIGNDFPANLSEIQAALERDRDDLPSASAFRMYCIEASEKMSTPDESEMSALFARFMDPQMWDGTHYGNGRRTLMLLPGMLPPPQSLITPDLCIGIVPPLLGRPYTAGTPRDAPNQPTSSSSASVKKGVIGTAFVGSICFDGSSIEASVHWLDESITSVKRPYDLFSLRVATGHPFAVNLAEYRATYKKFANFLDWLSHQRDGRLRRIMQQPEAEPAAIALLDLSEYENSTDGSDDDGDGEGDADTAMSSAV